MKDIECKEVIISRLTTKGNGTEENPYRKVVEVYDKDGTLIAQNDDTFKEVFPQFLHKIHSNQKDLSPEIYEIIKDKFWELI